MDASNGSQRTALATEHVRRHGKVTAVLSSFKHRMRSLLAAPGQPQFDHLNARIDNLEHALHRDLAELRGLIDERVFSITRLAVATTEATLRAHIDTSAQASRAHAEQAATNAAREYAAAAAEVAGKEALSAAREHAEAAAVESGRAATAAAREHAEAAVAAATVAVNEQFARLRSEVARIHRNLERLERPGQATTPAVGPAPAVTPAAQGSPALVDDLLYLAIEDRFRGDPQDISARQERYVPIVSGHVDDTYPLLDLGCGRGEWLALLHEHDVPSKGIDSNISCVEECRSLGLSAEVADLVEVLATSPDGSFGAITMFQVVEHLPFDVLVKVLRDCARVLRPGGVLVAETPNALNLRVAATNFWLDPTHVRPLHPQLLRLLAERSGFGELEDVFLNEIGTPLELERRDDGLKDWLTELSRLIDGPGDYALMAWTPAADQG